MSELIVIDLLPLDFDADSYLSQPLGGTQSAVMDTCISLAGQAKVTLFNGVSAPRDYGRLRIRPNTQITLAELAGARWIVFVSWVTGMGLRQLPARSAGSEVVLWAHHDIDQEAVRFLDQPGNAASFSRFLFVSRWQRDRYLGRFGIGAEKAAVIGNPYCDRALREVDAREKVFDTPRIIYSSTPFRGLAVLADAFPLFRKDHPGASLVVLSGMELYGLADNAPYASLFRRLAGTPGVTLSKPLGKLALYRELQRANVFSYPSTFPETFCIAALEARVAGNPLWLTRLGALPEIFADASFWEAPNGDAPSPEAWAEFMARNWAATQSAIVQDALAAQQAACRSAHSPAAVAGRLLRALGHAEAATRA
jgi:glycosyltransferase involved in cell wall biosynthesis